MGGLLSKNLGRVDEDGDAQEDEGKHWLVGEMNAELLVELLSD